MPRDWVWTFWRLKCRRQSSYPGSDGLVVRDGMDAGVVLWLMGNDERRDWDKIR